MKPDRTNYEIWLIDWFDGNLSDQQIAHLKEFLENNPDLREEADSYFHSRLFPDDGLYPNMKLLKRTPSQLYPSQFDQLAVAYLENDLSTDQAAEFYESMENDEEKMKVFNTFRKLKLIPPDIRYPGRKALLRKTPGARIIRMSATILSIAAGIALLVLSYFFVPRLITDRKEQAASVILPDSAARSQPVEIVIRTPVAISDHPAFSSGPLKNAKIAFADPDTSEKFNQTAVSSVDTSFVPEEIPRIMPVKVTLVSEIPFDHIQPENKLIASNIILTGPPAVYDDGRSRLNKFIARTFREKILKADSLNEAPLKSYEIAEAGIKGLNKLFGWQLALHKTFDENGELKSVYFSSKILKFNAPVRKSTPEP